MSGVFVDTSAWYALADTGDTYHQQATVRFRHLLDERQTFVTTNYVVSETYTLVRVRLGHAAGQDFLRGVRNSAVTQRAFVLEAWEQAAEDLLARYADHDFSYVDATSFIAMRRLDLQDAFAFDHHFTTAGFTLVGDQAS